MLNFSDSSHLNGFVQDRVEEKDIIHLREFYSRNRMSGVDSEKYL